MRLQFDIAKSGGEFLIDTETRKAPALLDEQAYSFEVGLFDNDIGQDLTGIDSCTLALYYGAEVELVSKDVTVPLDSDRLMLTHWNQGFERNFAVVVGADEMDYAFGEDETELEVYFIVTGTFGAAERLLGRGAATLTRSIPTEDLPLPHQSSPYVRRRDFVANSLLAADEIGVPTPRVISQASIVGRQTGGDIGEIAQISEAERNNGGQGLRAFAPDDVADMIASRLEAYVAAADFTAYSILASTTTGTPAACQIAAQEIVGRKGSGPIAGIPRISLSELGDGDSQELRAFAPWDVRSMVEEFAPSGGSAPDVSGSSVWGRQATGPATSIPQATIEELDAGEETELRAFSPANLRYAAEQWGGGEANQIELTAETIWGKQAAGDAVAIPRVSPAELDAGSVSSLRGWSVVDVRYMAERWAGSVSGAALSRVQELLVNAGAFEPWATNGAVRRKWSFSTNGGLEVVYDFVPNAIRGVCFAVPMPNGWDLGGVKAKLQFSATGGTGNVVWGVRARHVRSGDTLDSSYGTEQLITASFVPNCMNETSASATITPGGTAGTSGRLVFEVRRIGTSGDDTATAVTARLFGVKIQFRAADSAAW